MKKILWMIILALMIPMTAFAENTVNYKTDTVTVSGTASGRVGITVFCPDMWFEDIGEGNFSNDVVSFNMQTLAGEEGEYRFSFKQKDETGLYRYSVESQKGDLEIGSFVYVSTGDRETIVDTLNGAAKSEISGICETYRFHLEIDESVFANADTKTASNVIYAAIQKNPFDKDDFRAVSDTVKAAYEVGTIANGKVTSLKETEGVYPFIDLRIDAWMHSNKITDTRKKAIIAALKGSDTSFDDFSDRFIEKLVLYVVEQPNGTANLKELISDFEVEIGVDAAKLKNSDYNAVSGKRYTSLAELKKALAPTESGGGSGSGGGTGTTKPSNNNSAPNVTIGAPATEAPVPQVTYIMRFEDIDSVPWAYEAIASLARDGIISGRSETVFDPMGNVTREEFVKMLVGVLKLEMLPYTGGYCDVPLGAWYADYVETATRNGICQGIGNQEFGVGSNITRQDMCVMIDRAIRDKVRVAEGENAFVDGEKVSDYAKDAVFMLAALSLVHGNDKKEFLPQNNTTRAEAAVLLNSLKKYLEGETN